MEHLVPLRTTDWGFFDRQKDLFSSMFSGKDDEFTEFDRELEKMKRDMFTLKPMDMDMGMDMGMDFDSFGSMGLKSPRSPSSSSSSLLKVDRPIVQDREGNKRLALRFDCKQFKPEEISVKTIDNRLMIQAKHTEESPGRKVYREFSQQYVLPEKIDPVTLNSMLTADGVLSVEGPAPASVDAPRERILPIRML